MRLNLSVRAVAQPSRLRVPAPSRCEDDADKRCRPLGLGSTSKKVFVPNGSLYRAYTLLPRIRSARRYSNLCFRLLISDAARRAIACAEAIRSVTHLVLAPDPKKLSCSFFSYSQSFFVFSLSFLRLTGAPIPPQRDQKTFSAGPRSFSL